MTGDPIETLREAQGMLNGKVAGLQNAIERLEALRDAAAAVKARLDAEDDPAWDSPSELDALTVALAGCATTQEPAA